MRSCLFATVVLPILFLAGPGFSVMTAQTPAGNPAARLRVASDQFDNALAAARVEGALQPQSTEFARLTQEFSRLSDELLARGDTADAAFALLRSADCLRIMRQWNEARPIYQRVVPLAQRAGRADYEAKAWLGIGRLEKFGANDHRAAREAIDRALAAVGTAPDNATLRADILVERADLQSAAGELDQALASVSQAVTIARSGTDRDLLFNALFNRGGVHNLLTEALYKVYVRLPCLTPEEWQRCQQVEQEMRDHLADALKDLMQAQAVAVELKQPAFANAIQDELSTMRVIDESQKRTIALATQMYELALQQASAATRSAFVTTGGTLMDVPLLGPALPTTTAEQTQAVLAFMRRELSQMPDLPSTRWRRRLTEAQIFEGEGNLPAAISSYRESATLIEQERRTLPSDAERAGFTTDKVHVFDRLVLTLLSRADYGEAFRWNEQARARTMTEMLSSAAVQLPTDTERRLYSEFTAARAANQAAFAANETGAMRAADAQYEAVLARIRQEAPRMFEFVETPPASLDQLRLMTRTDRFDLVYYFLDNPRLIVWHIGSERMDVQSYYAPTSVLRNMATRLQHSLAERSSVFDADAARDLYFVLVQPLLARLDTKQLVVVLPPELENVPFAALMNSKNGQFLGETLTVSYVPSASVLMRLRQGAKLDGANVLALAGPRLDNAIQDVNAIAKTFPQHAVVLPASATRSTLMKEARGRSVIHLAAHGVYSEVDPMLSRIELQAEPGHDGLLTASDMLALPLDGVALVTVASCTAAHVTADAGGEIYGITRSLIYAGAQNVLLPLWEVDDEATSLWMAAFYGAARDVPLAEAVRRANIELRRHPVYGADPRFWAAFKLVGH
jgi:CHAT domain-containing protein/tetratricopeptide (TPR) repeat protein